MARIRQNSTLFLLYVSFMSNPLRIYIHTHISIVHDGIHSLIGLYIMHQLDYEILMDLGHIRVRPLVVGVCLTYPSHQLHQGNNQ